MKMKHVEKPLISMKRFLTEFDEALAEFQQLK